jgi:zinc transporter 1/2/3
MSPLLFKFLAGFIILLVTLACGLGPMRNWWKQTHSHTLGLAEAFAGGIFLGVALFHMLPDANRGFSEVLGQNNYPYANLLCAVGFMFLLGVENAILRFNQHRTNPIPYLLAAVLSLHAVIEGAALGISETLASTILIFTAIIVHKGSESLALAAHLTRNIILPKQAMFIFLAFSAMTPLGILVGDFLSETSESVHHPLLEPIFNALAAGTFLYIATLHKIHHQHLHEDIGNFKEFIVMSIGLASMALIAIWV